MLNSYQKRQNMRRVLKKGAKRKRTTYPRLIRKSRANLKNS